MLKRAPILPRFDVFEKTFDKIKNKKRFTNYFARKVIVNDPKNWAFPEIDCCSI